MEKKTYIVVRSDIPPGLQMAQACHAAIAFTVAHGVLTDNLVVLHVETVGDLVSIQQRADIDGIRSVAFHEPDLRDEVTAIALADEARVFLSSLPLAMKRAA